MGRLSNFHEYLEDRLATIRDVEGRLLALQSKYETYYQEVSRVREAELGQLSSYIAAGGTSLPADLASALERARSEVERELEQKLGALQAERKKAAAEAEAARKDSQRGEEAVHARNVDLDRREEALKARSARLLKDIGEYNRRIREMGTGFGFFSNFFRMRGLQRERRRLDAEQAELLAQMDGLRAQWVVREKEHGEKEAALRASWARAAAQAAALAAKIEALRESRPRMIFRSTVERVLYRFAPPERASPGPNDPPCPRCRSKAAPGSFFCPICAARLGKDRPDLAGSVSEMAELNVHFERFSEGMKACQQVIALVRGIASGLSAFIKSVDGVKDSEERYPLPKLEIDVPAASVEFGKSFDAFRSVVSDDLSLHPRAFAARIEEAVGKVFTEPRIKAYFETMGEELSRQAKAQWG